MKKLFLSALILLAIVGCGGNTRGTGGNITDSSAANEINITGQVVNNNKQPIQNANIYILETGAETKTDTNGLFSINTNKTDILTLAIEIIIENDNSYYEVILSESPYDSSEIKTNIEILNQSEIRSTIE
jgi:hypothetical protein